MKKILAIFMLLGWHVLLAVPWAVQSLAPDQIFKKRASG